MAKRIIWSKRAKEDKRSILNYWLKRNTSNVYPKRLNTLLKIAIKTISESTIPRKKTDYGDAYVKIVKDYFIIYDEDPTTIFILNIWDSRQDPEKLKEFLE